jgi:RNA polymerase sigma factor (TIGR02999 family)
MTAPARAGTAVDHQTTWLFQEMRNGDETALDRLLPLIYEELRRIARRQLRQQRAGHTLNTTALVHEAYLKLVDQRCVGWQDRAHFFAVAACAMRHILINHARRHATAKRGGRWRRVPLDDAVLGVEEQADLLLALDEALGRLAALNHRLGRVVECRFFGGMSEEEVAMVLDLSARTVRRDWLKARMWLYAELAEDAHG